MDKFEFLLLGAIIGAAAILIAMAALYNSYVV